MKGLVITGGYGTGLRPITYSQQKQLIPIANKPILFYGIGDIIKANIRDIGIVVGPNKEQVKETVNRANFDAQITFIEQDKPRGLAHTVLISEEFIGDEPFVMYLGDNILRGGIISFTKHLIEGDMDASILLSPHKNPSLFGCAELNKDGSVKRLIEKPKSPPSNFVLAGIYFFRKAIFEAAKHIKPSWRNELEITDAVQYLIKNGFKVHSEIVKGWWKDTGRPEDILDANRLILGDLIGEVKQEAEIKGEIKGKVTIGKGTKIDKESVVKGPVVIGSNCVIRNSYIGPYTSIGNNCEIANSEVEDSIVMDETKLRHGGKIVDSLIGKNVVIEKSETLPKGYKFILGDGSRVGI